MIRYGKDGEIWDNSHIIKMVNKIMSGDVPKSFSKRNKNDI